MIDDEVNTKEGGMDEERGSKVDGEDEEKDDGDSNCRMVAWSASEALCFSVLDTSFSRGDSSAIEVTFSVYEPSQVSPLSRGSGTLLAA